MFKPGIATFILASFAMAMVVEAQEAPVPEAAERFQPFSHQVPLTATGSGSFTVTGTLGGVEGDFLLDTGASMITVSREFLKSMTNGSRLKPSRTVAARFASGRVNTVDVYQFDTLTLGENCQLGPVEVAVMPKGGRNLLGMSALMNAAPFAVSASPPSLALSRCGLEPAVAAR